jgi:hypothetical protein
MACPWVRILIQCGYDALIGSIETEQRRADPDILPERLRRDHPGEVSLAHQARARCAVLLTLVFRTESLTSSGERAELGRGTTHLVKYSLVERWVSLGWAEVL